MISVERAQAEVEVSERELDRAEIRVLAARNQLAEAEAEARKPRCAVHYTAGPCSRPIAAFVCFNDMNEGGEYSETGVCQLHLWKSLSLTQEHHGGPGISISARVAYE